ncbi:hypothetical protein QCA50_002242 [Cerrena zonata]|uniref:SH3 domain-containing protein n=1 Tax=Cerrena zonata TaxID=2478898 RepID=A0AAW0GN41_9APHY
MTLKKDDIVELVEQDNNGWWLVKKNGVEGWAPSNYLELVPPKPKARPAAAPPPPPPPPAAPRPPAAPKTPAKAVTADASAKPVAVFPGMASSNGSATPWKKSPGTANGSSASTPAGSRPGSSLAGKPPPPPVASKPKPTPPPLANKPGAPKPPGVGGKPPIPTAPRPGVAKPPVKPGGAGKTQAVGGQMDLAAALARRAQKIADDE